MQKITIKAKKKGQHDLTFNKGGLHKSVNVAQGDKIPKSKIQAALHGEYGDKAVKQANFMKNVLHGGK